MLTAKKCEDINLKVSRKKQHFSNIFQNEATFFCVYENNDNIQERKIADFQKAHIFLHFKDLI